MKIPIPKQVLRIILGSLAFSLPIVLPLGMILTGAEQVLLPSISTYYYSEMKFLFIGFLVLFGAAFILYGFTSSRNLVMLVGTGVITLLIALVPTHTPGITEWTGYFHIAHAVAFFALLGWHTRVTFNLPLPYPLLTKIGLYIWITEGILIIYFLAFKWVWPPLVFFLEAAILWLFVFGLWVRNKITRELSKAR
ncbi:MAG: hypothetical protein KI791_01390 [Cyclobacteriaceae bacterium]|nr:hypothetical protein [Cyclobacteriaceae bacterium SS2]